MTDLWKVLNYEILMCFGVQTLQRSNIQSSDEVLFGITTNAVTEVMLLHLRVLTEVFLSAGRPDDIKIENLIPTWRRENSALLDDLENAQNGIWINFSPMQQQKEGTASCGRP